jgi:multiple sugar transport system substrate-binding protein
MELSFGAFLMAFATVALAFVFSITSAVVNVLARRPSNDGEALLLRGLRRLRNTFRRPGRFFASVAVVAILVVFVIPHVFPPTSEDGGLEPGTISILSGFDESPSDPRRLLVEQWNRSHPDNRAEFVDAAGEPDDQHQRMIDDASQGGEHKADVYVLDVVWMEEFIKNGYIRRIDQSKRTTTDDTFIDNVLDICRSLDGDHNMLWRLPLNTDVGVMYYRSDLVPNSPENWGDYYGDAAKASFVGVWGNPVLRESAGRLKAANAAQLTDEEILTVSAFEAIWAHDGQLVNQDGRLVLNQDGTEIRFDNDTMRAIRDLSAAANDPDIVPTNVEAGASKRWQQSSDNDAVSNFKSGETLFMRNWPVAYDNLKHNDSANPVPFTVAKLPHSSVLGGQNLAISASSERPKAAQALIEFLASEPSQLILATVGGFAPTRESAYQSGFATARPYGEFLKDAVEHARPRPRIRAYTEFSRVFRRGIQEALRANGVIDKDLPKRLAEIAKK